jgi:branched-chain amino acid transport system ATP-binding protein
MLEIEQLQASYGKIRALKGISIKVNQAEIVTLIGANGAGKSTTMKVLMGLMKPAGGAITFCGTRIDGLSPDTIVRKGICLIPEGRQIFPGLTVLENLRMGAYTQSSEKKIQEGLEKAFELFPVLAERRKQTGGTLSGGEQQMLAIARGLMSNPSLLALDEPSMGLAPLIIEKIFQVIKDINASGVTVFLVEQKAPAALAIAHRAYVLETGSIVMEGKASDLMNDPNVRRKYLGG